jgi:hypothetical protein
MSSILSFLIYFIIFAYLAAGTVNFFLPISGVVAVLVIAISILLSYTSTLLVPIGMFLRNHISFQSSKRLFTASLLLLMVWSTVVIWRPTVGDDAIGYHLPLSLLMNNSIWYPGIAKLSSHYGFPNGISVLASILTAFDVLSLENVPNLIIWVVFGIGIFLYLISRNVSPLQSGLITLVFLLSPDFFWQSYNMGTDLPAGCFLTFGLLAWTDRRWYESYLFLALSATFKPLGAVALLLIMPYILFLKVRRQEEFQIHHPQVIVATLLLTVTILRIYIATGNPFYPTWPLNLAEWGISSDLQQTVINGLGDASGLGLRQYVGVERTVLGYLSFMVNFVMFPNLVKGSYWFSPLLISSFAVGTYYFIKERYYCVVSQQFWYTLLTVQVLLLVWLFYSPIFRFAAGVFSFISVLLFVFCQNRVRSWGAKSLINAAAGLTLALFTLNVGRHIDQNIVAVIRYTPEAVNKWMPWEGADKSKFSIKHTPDGFLYSKAVTTYCVKMPPPCISMRSLADENILIAEYRKYNRY